MTTSRTTAVSHAARIGPARRRTLFGAGLATLSVAALASALPSEGAASKPATTPTRPAQLVTEWAAAWNSSDDARLGALFTKSGVYTDHAFEVSFTGRKEIASWLTITAGGVNNLRVAVKEVIAARNSIAVRWKFSGQLAGAPKPFTVPVATLIKTESGRISSLGDFYNRADVLRQSGLPLDTSFGPPPPR